MKAILHTRSGKSLTVDVILNPEYRFLSINEIQNDITKRINKSGMRDKVIRTEIPLFIK